MNTYDFDKTVRKGDSTVHFCLWCASRYPAVLLDLPAAVLAFMRAKRGRCTVTEAKQTLFRFLRRIPDVDAQVDRFWRKDERFLYPWYLAQKRPDDVIISASPEFLLRPVCERLGVTLLASRVDANTGVFTGENCHGEEKVRRFYEAFPEGHADTFYSDSLSDTPMAREAERAFRIVRGRVTDWPK